LCRDPHTGTAYILVGQERRSGNPWCFPYGKAEKKDKGNRKRTAAREACEETCYALGLPGDVYRKYFRGKDPQRFGGAYLIDLGFMTETDRRNVIKRHLENRNGRGLQQVLQRRPKGCEREMVQLKWCDGSTFLKHAGGSIPGFGHFRGFCARIMRQMAKSRSFSNWCKQDSSSHSSGSASSSLQARHASLEEESAMRNWSDNEYDMFVQAVRASLADVEFSNNIGVFEEDEMLAVAVSASLASHASAQNGFEEQSALEEDEMLALALRASLADHSLDQRGLHDDQVAASKRRRTSIVAGD